MLSRTLSATALVSLTLIAGSCARDRPPVINISDNIITVENQTSREWRNVVLTVNDHFRGGARVLAPGGRLTAPLSQFQTGSGQRFDTSRQSVFKIEVAATDSGGEAVKLQWGNSKR